MTIRFIHPNDNCDSGHIYKANEKFLLREMNECDCIKGDV